jgi:capsular polysaccharide biosynthesis protein
MLYWLWFSAFLGGGGLAFLFEHLDDTLKRSEEMERVLGLPTLGTHSL